jgi:hypothetical protein
MVEKQGIGVREQGIEDRSRFPSGMTTKKTTAKAEARTRRGILRVWKKLGTEYCVFRKKRELFSPAVVPVVGGKVEMCLETAWMAGLRWG